MKFRLWRRIKWQWINCYIRFMLRLFGDEIHRISSKMIGGKMSRQSPSQRFFLESVQMSTDIEWLERLASKRLEQLDLITDFQWKIVNELKQLCRELPVNYKKRFPIVDKFLSELGDKIVLLDNQQELIRKICDAVDSFCAGDLSAVEEINGT